MSLAGLCPTTQTSKARHTQTHQGERARFWNIPSLALWSSWVSRTEINGLLQLAISKCSDEILHNRLIGRPQLGQIILKISVGDVQLARTAGRLWVCC